MAVITKYAGAFSTSAGSTWTNGANIYANDGAYATTAGYRNANRDIIGSNFGFAIPAGYTINSVTVKAEYKLSTAASAWTGTLQAQYNGTLRGTAATTTSEPLTDTIWTKSTLNGTWTVDELNNNLLQVLFRVRRSSNTACTYSVDYLSVTVDYTPTAPVVTATPDISKINGSGVSSVSVSANHNCTAFEARATLDGQSYGRGIGTNVISDDVTVDGSGVHTFSSPTNSWSFDVAYGEIASDGTYRISVYALNADSLWSS